MALRDEVTIEANGWTRQRSGKGNHEIWVGPTGVRSIPVATTIKSRHAASAILTQAGLPKAF